MLGRSGRRDGFGWIPAHHSQRRSTDSKRIRLAPGQVGDNQLGRRDGLWPRTRYGHWMGFNDTCLTCTASLKLPSLFDCFVGPVQAPKNRGEQRGTGQRGERGLGIGGQSQATVPPSRPFEEPLPRRPGQHPSFGKPITLESPQPGPAGKCPSRRKKEGRADPEGRVGAHPHTVMV